MQKIKIAVCMLLCLNVFSCSTTKKTTAIYLGDVRMERDTNKIKIAPVYDSIQKKYAALLKVDPAAIVNPRLYYFIEKWINTPYKWGGMNEKGIDCSAFLQKLLAEVYAVRMPRTSLEQFFASGIEPFGSPKYLSEGDLVFFRTSKHQIISHVGLYLHNKMFVNSSSTKGVSIADLDDPYWKTRYVAAGRVKMPGKIN